MGGGGPLKTNMEPKNHPIEKENPRPKPSFLGSILIFRGVNPHLKQLILKTGGQLALPFRGTSQFDCVNR